MTDDKRVFIIGAPAWLGSSGVPGTRHILCEQCQQPALFSPASFNRPEAATATFICMECIEKVASDPTQIIEVAPITAEQAMEIVGVLGKAKRCL